MTKGLKTKTPVLPKGNLEFAQAMHGKHNLTHDSRPKRARTRSAAKRRAIKDF
jgi:hypothetical protein